MYPKLYILYSILALFHNNTTPMNFYTTLLINKKGFQFFKMIKNIDILNKVLRSIYF